MTAYLNIAKVSEAIFLALEKGGDLNVSEQELFKPLAGELSSGFFDTVLGWMQKQGLVTRNESHGQWSVSLTDRGFEQRRVKLAGRKS